MKGKYKSFLLFITSFSISSFAQLILNNGAVVKLNGGTSSTPVFFVLDTPPATPIKTIVTVGTPTNGIIMEAEFNILQYNLATATTPITVPYLSNTLEQIPLTLTPTSAGIGSGNIKFSSIIAPVRSTGWDNFLYKPTDVTNMGALGISNNSDKTIDRFWIIDATNYTTKPAVTLDFTYIDAEWAANGSNLITEANLRAQRFNNTATILDWQGLVGFPPAGTINTTNNTVSTVNVSPADFYRSWTLNDNSKPLPIELINFEATCVNKETLLEWCTASETNNNFFTIKQSTDGINFSTIININGSGTTNQKNCYQFHITNNNYDGVIYYELWQTDFDNTTKKLKLIAVQSCIGKSDNITVTNNGTKNVTLFINLLMEENNDLIIHNTLGQIVLQQPLILEKDNNYINLNLNKLSNGVYYISVVNKDQILSTKKIIIADN